MQLRVARLCLDCEEVHGDFRCPVCASDSFAYITKWVPVEERRQQRRAEQYSDQPSVGDGSGPSRKRKWVKRGAIGLAVLAATAGWLGRPSRAESPTRE